MQPLPFHSLEELYAYLETDIIKNPRNWELTRDIQLLWEAVQDQYDKQKIRWEMIALDFTLREGRIFPLTTALGEDGVTVYAYPSLQEFGPAGLAYLQERAKEASDDNLVARYNQILWNSEIKHRQNATNCIDAYLRILSITDCNRKRKKNQTDCLNTLQNSLHLSIRTKYRIDDHRALCHSFLFDKDRFESELKVFVLDLMLAFPVFKPDDFNGTLELLRKLAARSVMPNKQPSYSNRIKIFETAGNIAQKCKTDTRVWKRRIGDAYVKTAESRLADDESRIAPLNFYQKAIPYYKMAGQKKKVRDTEKKYADLKKELKLKAFEIPVEDAKFDASTALIIRQADKLLRGTPDEILLNLTNNKIFPSQEQLERKETLTASPFANAISVLEFDINKNLRGGNRKKSARSGPFNSYDFYARFFVIPYLHRTFIEGVKRGKITYEHTINFLIHRTWLGQTIIDTDSTGENIGYNWISLLAPSLHSYFLQLEGAIKATSRHTNFILAIDSLTLKFEGMLRDFAQCLGLSTTISGKGDVMREMYVEEVLSLKEMRDYFDEEDRALFLYLFTKEGYNLRNNVAHSFFRYQHYSIDYMHLMICALLKIGKYRMTSQ